MEEGQGIPEAYENAWIATRVATVQEGKSWSGRERNHTFLGVGDAQFVDVSRLTQADSVGDGRSSVILDWDGDGRLDILLKSRTAPRLRLYRNTLATAGNSLDVVLRGNGTTSNRDAVGATVRVKTLDANLRQGIHAGEGFLAQPTKRLHFGLGSSLAVEELRVCWPDGTETVLRDLEANHIVEIAQGRSEPVSVQPIGRIPVLVGTTGKTPETLSGHAKRVVLASELPMGPVRIPSFADPGRRVSDLEGEPVLLNLWRADCAPCLKELGAFGRSPERVAEIGVRIVPLSLDGPAGREQAIRILDRLGLDGRASGALDRGAMEVLLGVIYAEVHPPRNNVPFSTPTSFLLDARGNLLVIYHGEVSLDLLAADLAIVHSEDPSPVLDRLRHGLRLVHHTRDFGALADAIEALAQGAGEDEARPSLAPEEARLLAEYYHRVEENSRGYVLRDGKRVPLPRARN